MALVFLNENWLPKSVLCLRDYDRHKFLLDLIAGDHGWLGGAAAGDGVCHCVGTDAAGGDLLRDRYWVPDFGAGRVEDADWRADRALSSW